MLLQGELISIKPVTRNDLSALCGWWNDPVVMKQQRVEGWHPTLKDIQEKYWPAWQNPAPEGFHMFIIWQDDRQIGEISYRLEDPDNRTVSVDIKIGEPSLWGQGLGTEAMKLLVSHLFEEVKARRITADVGDWNDRSLRMFGKCGFREIRRVESPPTDAFPYYTGGTAVIMQLDNEPEV